MKHKATKIINCFWVWYRLNRMKSNNNYFFSNKIISLLHCALRKSLIQGHSLFEPNKSLSISKANPLMVQVWTNEHESLWAFLQDNTIKITGRSGTLKNVGRFSNKITHIFDNQILHANIFLYISYSESKYFF